MFEKSIENEILDALNKLPQTLAMKYDPTPAFDPVLMRRLNRGKYVLKGAADIIAIHKGIFCAIEVKRRGEKPDPHQIAFLEKIARCGGRSGYATNVDEALYIVYGTRSQSHFAEGVKL